MNEYFGWKPYVPVAARKHQAARRLADLKKKGRAPAPVTIDGRKIAASFWGESWCGNLERYSDYATRLPRGRSYVRNGCVLDLRIAKGKVVAMVSGSELYDVTITISPLVAGRWKAICRDCTGTIDSLVELLQGRLAKGVMDRVCRQHDGLFPAPNEIKLRCSCPDWADMCKHVAAVLYGIGARLDREPELLFVLRGVDVHELLAGAGEDLTRPKAMPAAENILHDGDVAALFGLEMAEGAVAAHVASPGSVSPPATGRKAVRKRATAAGSGRRASSSTTRRKRRSPSEMKVKPGGKSSRR
jgi:uncharacterized Zn finger protein